MTQKTPQKPEVSAFFDDATKTVTYIVADPDSGKAAIIDSVLDYDPASGRLSTASADKVIEEVRRRDLTVEWVLDTHVHADHLTATPYIREKLGGQSGIGEHVKDIQSYWRQIFNALDLAPDGKPYDRLFPDGDTFSVGDIEAHVIHTPGHTAADVTYVIGDAAFVGDTLFMPDYGTARTDFPGGDAHELYRSTRKIFALPDETRLFMCHDYLPDGRADYRWETTVAEEKTSNVHLRDGVSEEAFVATRQKRDAGLDTPRLLYASLQVNMRGGDLPPADDNGTVYFRTPIKKPA
ncbi:MBL fold metallo-hydrolase [Parvibaculum sp. MBR-TMA-1.3b-4.2]|jgi:glyoxylase-like metal-dependent hydrolase (beta-lactamase superfamily II)